MALISCPECGREISDKASACPHCGFPVNATEKSPVAVVNDIEEKPQTGSTTGNSCKKRRLTIIIIIAAALVVLTILSVFVIKQLEKKRAADEIKKAEQQAAEQHELDFSDFADKIGTDFCNRQDEIRSSGTKAFRSSYSVDESGLYITSQMRSKTKSGMGAIVVTNPSIYTDFRDAFKEVAVAYYDEFMANGYGDKIFRITITFYDDSEAFVFENGELTYEAFPEAKSISGKTEENDSSISSSTSIGEQNALKKAQSYLSSMNFSRSGLIEQLEYEGFSLEEATYAVDNVGADWYEQAAGKAERYLKYMSFSRSRLIDQLVYDGFTQEEANYGAQAVGY